METDANELLIFKKRGLSWTESKAAKPREEPIVQPVQIEEPTEEKKPTKAEKARTDSAKGRSCFNHPWRAAYATCDYCKRAFCYADLVSHKGMVYCIEDIDAMSRKAVERRGVNPFTYLTALIFIAISALLSYHIYPEANFLVGYIAKIGVEKFIYTMTTSYLLSLLNILLAALGAFSFIAVLSGSRKGFTASGIIIGMMLILFAYEYLNTNANYFFTLTVTAFVGVWSMAFSRMSAIGARSIQEAVSTEIEWPRIETF